MDLMHHVEQLKDRNIVLIQNTLDTHHYEKHYKPFCAAMGVSADANINEGRFRRILFEHEGGHSKAETPEVFDLAMRIVQEKFGKMGEARTF